MLANIKVFENVCMIRARTKALTWAGCTAAVRVKFNVSSSSCHNSTSFLASISGLQILSLRFILTWCTWALFCPSNSKRARRTFNCPSSLDSKERENNLKVARQFWPWQQSHSAPYLTFWHKVTIKVVYGFRGWTFKDIDQKDIHISNTLDKVILQQIIFFTVQLQRCGAQGI